MSAIRNWPARIYLTRGDECVSGGCSGPCDNTQWCRDKINDADIEYVRVDLYNSLLARLRKAGAPVTENASEP